MKIGDLARVTNTRVETIRYYEAEGLIPAPARTAGNYRDYEEAHLNRLSFIRRSPGAPDLVCVANFAAVPHGDYHLALPSTGEWEELVNTDAEAYTGSGVGNLGTVTATDEPHQGQPASARTSASVTTPSPAWRSRFSSRTLMVTGIRSRAAAPLRSRR